MDAEALSKAFVQHYYNTFDTNRGNLFTLYQDSSMLTFEGEKFVGVQSIQAKLSSLPFQQCQHTVITTDCQSSGPAGGFLVFVSGTLSISDQDRPLRFSQMFHLLPTNQGSYYVLNDIFRLNYG